LTDGRPIVPSGHPATLRFSRRASSPLVAFAHDALTRGLEELCREAATADSVFRHQLGHVEVSLQDGRRYLMGDRFTSADMLLTTCLVWAIEYGVGVCDNARPYLERVTSRPAYQRSFAANAADI
jgi:glutathione S-transferase